MVAFSLFLLVSVKAQEASAALLEALSYVPTSETLVTFTDIDLIKQYENEAGTNSQSPREEKVAFLKATSHQAILVDYNLLSPEHAERWNWDVTDVRWITEFSSSVPVTIVALREDFDLSQFTSLLDERGFSKSALETATLYQHELDMTADWLPVNIRIVNTAILEPENVMIMSPSPEQVEAVIKAYNNRTTYATAGSVRTIAERLGEVAAAVLETNACSSYSVDAMARQMLGPNVSQEQLEAIQKEFAADLAKVTPYQILALAYRYEKEKPLGTLILSYGGTTDAQNDLEARQTGASKGRSFVVNSTYSEVVFGLESAEALGNNLIFKLRPVDNKPQKLFDMFYKRDMAFAGC